MSQKNKVGHHIVMTHFNNAKGGARMDIGKIIGQLLNLALANWQLLAATVAVIAAFNFVRRFARGKPKAVAEEESTEEGEKEEKEHEHAHGHKPGEEKKEEDKPVLAIRQSDVAFVRKHWLLFFTAPLFCALCALIFGMIVDSSQPDLRGERTIFLAKGITQQIKSKGDYAWAESMQKNQPCMLMYKEFDNSRSGPAPTCTPTPSPTNTVPIATEIIERAKQAAARNTDNAVVNHANNTANAILYGPKSPTPQPTNTPQATNTPTVTMTRTPRPRPTIGPTDVPPPTLDIKTLNPTQKGWYELDQTISIAGPAVFKMLFWTISLVILIGIAILLFVMGRRNGARIIVAAHFFTAWVLPPVITYVLVALIGDGLQKSWSENLAVWLGFAVLLTLIAHWIIDAIGDVMKKKGHPIERWAVAVFLVVIVIIIVEIIAFMQGIEWLKIQTDWLIDKGDDIRRLTGQ